MRAALDVLLEGVPDDEREAAAALVLQAVARVHRDRNREPPGWLRELQGE